jgi:hypothetical protein
MMVGEAIGKTIHKLHALAKSLQQPECRVQWWPGSSRSVGFSLNAWGFLQV